MTKQSLTEDEIYDLLQRVTEALRTVDQIVNRKESDVAYETMQKSGFNRPTNWRRKYSLADARSDARSAAIQLRAAWEIIDPVN